MSYSKQRRRYGPYPESNMSEINKTMAQCCNAAIYKVPKALREDHPCRGKRKTLCEILKGRGSSSGATCARPRAEWEPDLTFWVRTELHRDRSASQRNAVAAVLGWPFRITRGHPARGSVWAPSSGHTEPRSPWAEGLVSSKLSWSGQEPP